MIVVWFIAGMSLLVAGTVAISRSDLRMAQMHMAKAKVAAAGDGAIQLALAKTVSGDEAGLAGKAYEIGDLSVQVTLIPSSRFINMNEASEKELSPLFQLVGGAGDSEADHFARAVVEWRKPKLRKGGRVTRGTFYSVEDLLRIEGITRTHLDRMKDFIVVGTWAQGGARWNNLSSHIKEAIATGSPAKIGEAMARMDKDQPGAAREGRTGRSSLRAFRADAMVTYGDTHWLRRRWVLMSPTEASGLPWKFVRTEAPRVYTNN